MSDLRTAAQQALEALEKYRQMMFAEAGCRWGAGDAAIAALRAALAQEQAEPEGSVCARCGALAFDPMVPQQAEPLTGLDMFLDPQDGLKPKRYKRKAEPMQEQATLDAAYQQWLQDSHAPALRRTDSQSAFAAGWHAALAQEQAEPKPMHPELRKMWEEHFDRCFRAMPLPLPLPLPVQEQAEPAQDPTVWVASKDGRVIYDAVSTDDVVLRISGDFEDDEQRIRYTQQIVDALNAALSKAGPLNLSDRAVQRRLAAQWGYVPAEQAEPVKEQAKPTPIPTFHPSRLALFARACRHPEVLEIMADCADCVDAENSAQHDNDVSPYDGAKWRALAAELRQQAAEIRAEDPEIWPKLVCAPRTPPRRTRVPLTEQEIERIHLHLSSTVGSSYKTVARAVEKASWEKNNGQA